jgi:hypothetical protein
VRLCRIFCLGNAESCATLHDFEVLFMNSTFSYCFSGSYLREFF